jgi:DNA (cytosine-5)-methyltransferase 1
MNERASSTGSFYEFFAGGGMARAGLGRGWKCLFANDIDEKKAGSYARNWGSEELEIADVAHLNSSDLPGSPDLVWASFPCQDLSLAGMGAGLKGSRSGAFWPFWKLIKGLVCEGRAPSVIVLENVCGALTSHGGRDFQSLAAALADQDYRFGALVLDAVHFVPQSRPRLFVVAVHSDLHLSPDLIQPNPAPEWTSESLLKAYGSLNAAQQSKWIWWNLPAPSVRTKRLSDLIEDEPKGVRWHTKAETKRLLDMMSPINQRKVGFACKSGKRETGAIYKRTRKDADGHRHQRAEIRFDGIAGCLRTPTGGSSRQLIVLVEGEHIRSRLLSAREAARLMGLDEDYVLPDNYNDAYHLAGDGLVVPVVSWLERHLLRPLVRQSSETIRGAFALDHRKEELVHA